MDEEIEKLKVIHQRMYNNMKNLPAFAKVAAPDLVRVTENDLSLLNASIRQLEWLRVLEKKNGSPE